MKVLVIGATGATGKEAVNQALAQGHTVTVLVRDAAEASFAPPVRKLVGDVLDSVSLERAVNGQDGVLCSLGSAATGPFKKMTMLSEGTRNLVAVMKAHNVCRLVCITGIGAGDSKGHGRWYNDWLVQPLMLRGVYEDKNRQEEVVRGSGLDWTLVRPAELTNGQARGDQAVRALTDLRGVNTGSISRADVAAWCLRELADARYQGQAPVLTY